MFDMMAYTPTDRADKVVTLAFWWTPCSLASLGKLCVSPDFNAHAHSATGNNITG